jgi:hypothetical protein
VWYIGRECVGVGGECAEHFAVVVVQWWMKMGVKVGAGGDALVDAIPCKWAWPNWDDLLQQPFAGPKLRPNSPNILVFNHCGRIHFFCRNDLS